MSTSGNNRGSPSGSRSGSRSGSPAREPMGGSLAKGGNFPPALGYDPARDSRDKGNKRLDLPAEAYMTKDRMQNAGFSEFARRPGFNKSGKEVHVSINQYRAMPFNDKMKVYQFDVSLRKRLAKYNGTFINDGQALAWSNCKIDRDEERIELDANHDLGPRSDGTRREAKMIKFTIRQTSEINLSVLSAYLNGTVAFNTAVLEALNFLDHVIRQGPSERLLAIRRNFYPKNPAKDTVTQLNNCLECVKGVYASVRMNQAIENSYGSLGINIDVANTAFYIGGQSLPTFIKHFLWMSEPKLKQKTFAELEQMAKPVRGDNGAYVRSEVFNIMMRLKRVQFTVTHRGKEGNRRPYSIAGFEHNAKYGAEGGTAKTVFIEDHKDKKQINLVNFYLKTYNYRVQLPNWPVVTTAKAGMFPIDACMVERMQRYPFKLDPDATAEMIKAAVTRPRQRIDNIRKSREMLKLDDDQYLKAFGLRFDPNMAKVKGRLLPPPRVQFGNKYADPKLSGRWDLRGMKFFKPAPMHLKNWGVLVLEGACQQPGATNFIRTFAQTFASHGNQPPDAPVVIMDQNRNHGQAVRDAIRKISTEKGPVQMLFVVIRRQDARMYERIKAAAECDNAVLTQVLLSKHVDKNQSQYHSNVAMKVNSKLGGTTCRTPHPASKNVSDIKPAFFSCPTMIIGADVTHPPPGEFDHLIPSISALTMSMDKDAARYAAVVQTNGHRIETVKKENIFELMDKMLPQWQENVGFKGLPSTIYYFRDGVSEGQFGMVIENEVQALKQWFQTKFPHDNQPKPRITVIVATKRHHIRLFPAPGHGDKNDNPHPGTLVESTVCHPFQWDFYLNSHSAIQGTARPVHYHVLLDENKCNPDSLQAMIYGQCYQYARSTTPVSLHPAIYYADIAAARARSHEDISKQIPNPKLAGKKDGSGTHASSFDARKEPAAPLLPMGTAQSHPINRKLANTSMWFI
ncbi:argonaute [Plectosphaerella plurivora]|uniref:Argonaute n=1 Tax=Plectosphaerella plurivora TaxID=936078 RepID=A0A9P8V3P7_9PEZI|nr:argonaute [Plectosphaerella plurivora]